jgi:hypothetical protein
VNPQCPAAERFAVSAHDVEFYLRLRQSFDVEQVIALGRIKILEHFVEFPHQSGHVWLPGILAGDDRPGHLKKRLDARLRPPEDQRMHIVGAFIGIDRLEIEHVPDDVKLIRYAIGAVHVARRSRNL